jgi:hypothetical protein
MRWHSISNKGVFMLVIHSVEARIAAEMLELAADEFGNHGCNDFELDNTPENLAFVKRLIAAGDYPEDEPNLSGDGTKIYLMDWLIMGYCADVLKGETGGQSS